MTQEQYNRINELYLKMYDKMLDYAYVNIKNHALAQEAVQDTFEIACKDPGKLLSSPSPEGWLMKAVYNTIRNTIRARNADKKLLEEYLLPRAKELSVTKEELNLKLLFENVADMDEFLLIMEKAVYGLGYEEMAQKRGISVVACRKRIERARKILQKKLKKDVTI